MSDSKSCSHQNSLKIGFVFNVEKQPNDDEPPDKYAEFDSEDTISHIKLALESSGHTVVPIEADKNALDKLLNGPKLDFIFKRLVKLPNNWLFNQVRKYDIYEEARFYKLFNLNGFRYYYHTFKPVNKN